MESNTFYSPTILLSDIVLFVGDEDFTFKSHGFYIGQIQAALEELSFDTFFDERYIDLAYPGDCNHLSMPENMFNIKQMYLFNGTDCNIGSSVNVYHKRNYIGKTTGSTARNKDNMSTDPFHNYNTTNENNYFFNIQNGIIYFSDKCSTYEKVRIVYNGTGGKISDTPFIPMFFRQAIIDWVVLRVLDMKIAADPVAGRALFPLRDRIDGKLNKPYDGSWDKAKKRVITMGSKTREDLKEYLSKLNY